MTNKPVALANALADAFRNIGMGDENKITHPALWNTQTWEVYAELVEKLYTSPPEITDEMVERALTVEYEPGVPVSVDIGVGAMRLILEAALQGEG